MTGARWRARLAFPLACAGALALLVFAFSNTLHNEFQFDDAHVIQENLFIRDVANIPRYFTDATTFSSYPANAVYRPLLTTTLAFDYWRGGGLEPAAFHQTQIALLVVIWAMALAFLVRLFDTAHPHPWNRFGALVAATLFVIHTANTETANYISARSEILAGIGVLGAFLLYVYAPWARRSHLYVLPMLVGALAKVSALIFVPLLIAYVVLVERGHPLGALFTRDGLRDAGSALRATAPVFVIGAAMFVFIEAMNAATATYGDLPRLAYLQTQAFVWLHYAKLFLLPVGLTADTDWHLIYQWYDTRVAAGVLFLCLLVWGIWRASAVAALRPVAFGLAWFAIALLPASSIIPLAEVANEHRIFLPFAGMAAAAVWGALHCFRRFEGQAFRGVTAQHAAIATAVIVLGAHTIGTRERNTAWRTDETLWRDVVAKSPANGRALMNYGLSQMKRGRYPEARDWFERAQPLLPNYVPIEVNLGIINGQLGAPEVADRHFARALEIDPGYASAHYYYGRWLSGVGRANEAVPMLHRAVELSPALVGARVLLMRLSAATGDDSTLREQVASTLAVVRGEPTATAFSEGRLPIEVDDTTAAGLFAAGLTRTFNDEHVEAAILYRAARAKDSLSADFQNAYGGALLALGFREAAVPLFERALRLRPDFPLARENLTRARGAAAR